MNPLSENTGAALRRAVYWLLIVTSAAAMTGRIVSVRSESGRTPFLSANDRSRWCTIRALVDYRRYSIDEVVIRDPTATEPRRKFDPDWQTIDMVRHVGPDGKEHYYSSKPALLTTLLAALYWIIKSITGVGLGDHPFYVARYMLIITNVLPLTGAWVCLYRLLERSGTSNWGRVFVMACATWGTFLTTFAVTLNNHLPAAVCAIVAVYAALPIWWGDTKNIGNFVVAGLMAALAASFEFPALALLAAIGAGLLIRAPIKTLAAFVPPVLVVAAAFFLCEFAAHGSFLPAYAHRSDGPIAGHIEPDVKSSDADATNSADGTNDSPTTGDAEKKPEGQGEVTAEALQAALGEIAAGLDEGKLPEQLRKDLSLSAESTIRPSGEARWAIYDPAGEERRFAVVRAQANFEVRHWNNWYDYEGSYWTPEGKRGIDRGEASRSIYAYNVLVGHHGIFSLTPIWVLSLAGLLVMLFGNRDGMRGYALMVLAVSGACLVFYLMRPLEDRNYGGVSSGLRWLFWLAPLWLVGMVPVCDALAKYRAGRFVGLALLLASGISAAYGWTNPWSHPWILDYWLYMQWIAL
jgi:hypothetical protein